MDLSNIILGQDHPPAERMGLLLGIAAITLVAGWTITRFQRDRLRFALMRTAPEKGVTQFPGTPPYWLVSLRQGVTLVAVGLGLAAAGATAWWMVRDISMPTPASKVATTEPSPISISAHIEDRDMPPPVRPDAPRREDHDDRRPPQHDGPPDGREGFGPTGPPPERPPRHDEHDGDHARRDDRPHEDHPGGRPEPHGFNPEMDRWHEARAQATIGLVSAGTGMILILLGLVRIVFAKLEQRYTNETGTSAGY